MEEREFSMTATVTKVYETEVRVMATSDENARAQFQELRSEIANGVEEDQLVECMVEEEGCYDPISSLDD